MEYRASLLAGHGFATLALAYYNFEDLPKEINSIHLDYFEEALCYMLQHSEVLLMSFIISFSLEIHPERVSLCTHRCQVPGCCDSSFTEISFGAFLGFRCLFTLSLSDGLVRQN